MEEKVRLYGRVAGILYGILALMSLTLSIFDGLSFDRYFIMTIEYILLAVVLLRGKRDLFPAIIFAFYAIVSLSGLNLSFTSILFVLGKISIALIVIVSCTDFLSKFKPVVKNCYFVPAVLAALGSILHTLLWSSFTGGLSFFIWQQPRCLRPNGPLPRL